MTDTKHHIYLAVPGTQLCWGTVTGVVNSTKQHVVHPFNGGLGFSGTVDFNHMWTDAQNLYESGEITHFAMLHGDLTPDPNQRWIDILMEELASRDAELVSAHSPIKDGRGLTSSGICDPTNPWGAYRRFTQREILNDFPETFNAEMAGYPNQPLLHNTGCWICDLRKPVFRETNEDGSLKTLFKFPERITRHPKTNKWQKEQESEDWCLSRELWERGARNTWITRRVRLTHHGKIDYPNWVEFGRYQYGDENTADRWRKEADAKPLAVLQMLEFELGTKCNLGHVHTACPNMRPDRFELLDTAQELDDAKIVECATVAYRDLGFTGLVGWIYYNEPLLQAERMFRLMAEIKAAAPKARFILWTNGTLIPEDCEQYREFSQIVISGYNDESRRGRERLIAKKIDLRWIDNAQLDNRLHQLTPSDPTLPCLRPFVELIVDGHGNTHICCYDWRGESTLGNVYTADFAAICQAWRNLLPAIVGNQMGADAPAVCCGCGHRWDRYQMHDERIVNTAKRYRAGLQQEAATANANL